jgi:hypothetical protein
VDSKLSFNTGAIFPADNNPNLLIFTMPFSLFEEMEQKVKGSFLECRTRQSLIPPEK